MKFFQRTTGLWAVALLFLLMAGSAVARVETADKAAVMDGRYVHDVGTLWHHVTNWGMIGSAPSVPTTFGDAPSAMWPGGSGHEYLWAAGLWVGGSLLGEQLVSTGGFSTEFMPTEAEGDTVFPTSFGAPGGSRYPWDLADDDGDGLEDEDALNGLDDDGDGLVDEDFAAIGDQHFFARYSDFEEITQETHPDHTPLNVQIVQQTIQWSDPLVDDFVAYDFTITNVGVVPIADLFLGLFSDNDIGPRSLPGIAIDDHAGFFAGQIQATTGTWVSVSVSYMYDGAASNPLNGYAGWVVCGHPTDPTGQTAPSEVGVRSFQRFAGQVPFGQGGDPTNDTERYDLLSRNEWDANTWPGQQADFRTLISSGPFAELAPGESISYQVALVLGGSLEEMLANAAEAVLTYQGVAYDRDGDPANGEEFAVHWLRPEDAPVAAGWGRILAEFAPDGVALSLETNLEPGEDWQVLRRAGPLVSERIWRAEQLEPTGFDGEVRLFSLVDHDPVGWPRTYELVQASGDVLLTLDRVDLQAPRLVTLKASPNPFNPRVNISLAAAPAEKAVVEIFDLRGRRVATLWNGPVSGGAMNLTWQGQDDGGRSLASGVYEIRMTTQTKVLRKRITLIR